MRKSALVVILLLLFSLPMLYITPNPTPNQTTKTTTTTITTQRAGGTNYTVSLLTNQNFTGIGSDYLQNWTYDEWGNNPEAADGDYSTSYYYNYPASAYLRLRYNNRQSELGWTQPFTYTGTTPVVSALLTFWWRCTSYSYAGSTNYVEIWMELPKYSGNWTQIWHEHFYSTTAWNFRSVDISSYLNDHGAATYQFEADAYLTTGYSSYSTPQVRVNYDYVKIAVTYTVINKPSALSVTINNNATYTNNRTVTLSLTASGADKMYLSNTSTLPPHPTWEPFSTTKKVSLTLGDGTKNIYFWANNTAGVTGPTSDSIVYDGIKPSTVSLSSPTDGTAMNNYAPTFTWGAASDATSGIASYTFQIDTSTLFNSGNLRNITGITGTSYTVTSSLGDGTWYWRVRAVDNAGNLGDWSSPYRVIIVDTVYPTTPTLQGPLSGSATNDNTPTFTWINATDTTSGIASHTLQYSKDPNFVTDVTTITGLGSSYTVPGGSPLSDGTWYWRVSATDKAGNLGSYSGYWSIVIDTVAPGQPTLSSPSSGIITNNNKPPFIWSATSDPTPSSGIASYTLQYTKDPSFTTGVTTVPGLGLSYTLTNPLDNSTYYWRVSAVDRAGNIGTPSASWSIVVDRVPPGQPTLISPANNAQVSNTPTFTWNPASDSNGIAYYTLQLDTSNQFNSGDLRTISGITGTSYTVVSPLRDASQWWWHVEATDNAGNLGGYSGSRRFTLTVTSGPLLQAPASGLITKNNTQTFSWNSVSGASGYNFYIDTSPAFNTGNLRAYYGGLLNLSKVVTGLGDGNWYWKVAAMPGTVNSTVWGIMIDTVAPSPPTLSSPANGAYTNFTTSSLVWNSVTSDASGVSSYTLQYSQDPSFEANTTVLGLGLGYTVSLGSGTWYWRVCTIDKAGNRGIYSGNWNLTIDTTPPTISYLSLGGSYTKTLMITLNISATGADVMYLSNDGSNWMSFTFAASMHWNLTASDGLKQVYFECRDKAGNWAYLPGGFTSITLDTVPPIAGSPSVPAYGLIISDNRTALQWIAGSDTGGSGIANYTLQLDDNPLFNNAGGRRRTIFGLTGTSYTVSPALTGGTWYWRISATDRADNTGFYSTYSSFILNTTLPGKIPYDSNFWQPVDDSSLKFVSPQFIWNSTVATGAKWYHIQIDRYLNFSSSYLIENLTLPSNRFSPSVDNNKTLIDGTWYWRVEAINIAGAHSGYSTTRNFTIDTTPPNSPNLIAPADQIATRIRDHIFFSWSPVPGAEMYWMQFDRLSTFDSSDVYKFTFINLTKTSIFYNESLFDGLWYWHVFSLDSLGNINNSILVPINQFMIDTGSPSPPYPISPSQGGFTNQTTPTLTWSPAADPQVGGVYSGVANYTLSLDNSSSFNSTNLMTIAGLVQAGPDVRYTLTSSLSDGVWYWFVNATDRAGNIGPGFSIIQRFTVDTIAPAPPLTSSMTPNGATLGTNLVSLRWAASSDTSGIAGYIIQIDISSGFDGGKLLSYTIDSLTSFVPPDTLDNGQWYWRMAAVDGAGNQGPWSEAVPFVVNAVVGISPMMVIMLGGGSSGVVVLAVLGYVFYRRAKIPFVIKKLDQSIKLISRGEMPQLVPMRTRSQLIASIYRDKLAILSKEKIEKAEEKKKKVSKEAELGAEKLAPQRMPKGAEAPVKAVAEESDVDLVAKELEKLEGEGSKSADESEMIKREIDELEKGSKKKKDESD